jgi:hypothetical protein
MTARIPGSKPRPVCALCGKPYGQRDIKREAVFVSAGEPVPKYRGNGHVVQETIDPKAQRQKPGTEAPTPGTPEYYSFDWIETGTRVSWQIWDGETYWSTNCAPFCGNTCAIAFAKAAYRDGARYTIPKKDPA